MFDLLPKKKSVDEILEDTNLTPPWEWTPTQTPSMLQAQNELIEQFLKENHDLKKEIQELKRDVHQPELCNEKIFKLREENVELKKILIDLKKENADLIEILAKYRDGYQGSCYACEPVGELNQKLEKEKTELLEKYNGFLTMGGLKYMEAKLQIVQNNYTKCAKERDEYKHQLNAANKERNEYKESFESMKKAYEQEAKSADRELEKRLELEKEVEKLKKDIVDYVFEKDNQVNFFEEELKRLKSITKEEYDKIPVVGSADIIGNLLQKANDLVEGVEVDLDKSLDEQCDKEDETAFLKCACGDCHEKTKQYNQFQEFEECKITGHKIPKEKSWEEAASDLALKVTKLEEQLKIHKLLIDQLNNYILCLKH